MKLYKYTCGDHEAYGVAENDQDAYDRRAEVHPTFHYIPVKMEEVKVEGYEISVTPLNDGAEPGKVVHYREDQSHIVNMDRDQLKALLKSLNIEFTPQWGRDKLREIALQNT